MSTSIDKIYLFYHEADNNYPVYEDLGWVEAFNKFLGLMLKQLGGKVPDFEKITDDRFVNDLPDTYFVIIFASKQLMTDKKTLTFFKQLEKLAHSGKVAESKIIKVQKHFFPKDLEPKYLLHFKDYAFYKARGIGDTGTEYKDFVSGKEEKTFWVKLADLAYELFAYSDKDSSGTLDISKYKVFLAETSFDAEKYRTNLKRDLESMGMTILPEKAITEQSGDFILNVDDYVKKTDFAIHLVANHFGETIDNTGHSKDEIQAKITENYAYLYHKTTGGSYRRFFWFDKIGLLQNEKINQYYKELSHKVEESKNTDLVVSSWEEFKSLIYQFVSFELAHAGKGGQESLSNSTIVYFIYDIKDEAEAIKYIEQLRKDGYAVISSNFEGDIMAVRHIHLEGLKRFDIAIIYARQVQVRWVNMKVLDILKAPGFGREKPIQKKLLMIPQAYKPQLLPTSETFRIIDVGVKPGQLKEFI